MIPFKPPVPTKVKGHDGTCTPPIPTKPWWHIHGLCGKMYQNMETTWLFVGCTSSLSYQVSLWYEKCEEQFNKVTLCLGENSSQRYQKHRMIEVHKNVGAYPEHAQTIHQSTWLFCRTNHTGHLIVYNLYWLYVMYFLFMIFMYYLTFKRYLLWKHLPNYYS